jgi:DNA primase
MTSPIQEIKERLDIVEFIRSYIPLLPAGKNFKAPCPFHKEKTPSFMVSPERQTWHCFGACGEGGDIFKFLMKYENLEFYEALKILAEKAGVELKKISPMEHKQFGVLFDINEAAKEFFKKELERSVEALKYLKERGLKKEIIEELELGVAPAGFDDLSRYLINLGFNIKDVERAGLNYRNERGSYIDRFRNRIMFPLYNHFGKAVGFSGRVLPGFEKPEIGKYVNSPETPIFNKSKLLYGLHKTKDSIRKMKSVVLVEGQMDFLLAYQDGIKNLAATSGTALTAEHLKTFKRLANELVFFFDNDEAGLNAAERAIDLAGAHDFNVKLLILKDFKDPAEAVEKSPGILAELVDNTTPAMEFYFARYLGEISNLKSQISKIEFSDLKKNLRIILAKIKNLASPVERAHWLKELSLKTGIDERALAEEMTALKSEIRNAFLRSKPPEEQFETITRTRRELIAQRLIGLAMLRENFHNQIKEYYDYLPEEYLMILKSLLEKAKLENERLNNLLNLISLRSSFEASILDEEKIEDEFQELLRQLRLEYLKEKRKNLIYKIKEAEKSGEEERVVLIMREFDEVSKALHNV